MREIGSGLRIAAVAAALALAACGQPSEPQETGVFTVIADGSSTVFPITEAAAAGFQAQSGGRIRVTVAESGTGGGFRKFCRGETHVQGASRPITEAEMTSCAEAGVTYIEAPIAFDALSVVVNPTNPIESLTVEQLKTIWAPGSTIKNWKDLGAGFPDLPISLYGPGTASGTFDYFTEAVVGEAKASRTDFTPAEDDNVLVQGVAGTPGALGYFGMAYYLANQDKIRAVKIDNGAGPIGPSAETVRSGAYAPLSRPVFIYVNAALLDRRPVSEFVGHLLDNAAAYANQVNYVPLPDEAYAIAKQRVAERKVGTVFAGKAAVGASIEEILAREVSDTASAAPGEAPAAPAP